MLHERSSSILGCRMALRMNMFRPVQIVMAKKPKLLIRGKDCGEAKAHMHNTLSMFHFLRRYVSPTWAACAAQVVRKIQKTAWHDVFWKFVGVTNSALVLDMGCRKCFFKFFWFIAILAGVWPVEWKAVFSHHSTWPRIFLQKHFHHMEGCRAQAFDSQSRRTCSCMAEAQVQLPPFAADSFLHFQSTRSERMFLEAFFTLSRFLCLLWFLATMAADAPALLPREPQVGIEGIIEPMAPAGLKQQPWKSTRTLVCCFKTRFWFGLGQVFWFFLAVSPGQGAGKIQWTEFDVAHCAREMLSEMPVSVHKLAACWF